MAITKLVLILVMLGAVSILGLHLIRNNRVVVMNLLRNRGIFTTKAINGPSEVLTNSFKWRLSRAMMYFIGIAFFFAGIFGAVFHIKQFLE